MRPGYPMTAEQWTAHRAKKVDYFPPRPGGYRFALTCPRCGGELAHVAGGSRHGWQQAAAAKCPSCHLRYLVNVTVSLDTEFNLKPYIASRQRMLNQEHSKAVERTRELLEGSLARASAERHSR